MVKREHRGAVLIDVLVAAMLLGIALAAMVSLSSRSLQAQRQGEDLQTAAMLLDEQLNLVLARGPDAYASSFPVTGACDPPFERFKYALAFGEGQSGSAYLITATVTWPTQGGTKSASVSTLMAPRLGDDPDPERKPADPILRY
jgi:Tfp pilus assembly protein PilV